MLTISANVRHVEGLFIAVWNLGPSKHSAAMREWHDIPKLLCKLGQCQQGGLGLSPHEMFVIIHKLHRVPLRPCGSTGCCWPSADATWPTCRRGPHKWDLCLQAIAKTGSGKTAAFVLPLLVHIMDQPELDKGTGPIGVIAAPARELAEQIHKEARKLAKPYNLRICAAFGGLSKYEQFKDLKGGSEVPDSYPSLTFSCASPLACPSPCLFNMIVVGS